MRVRLLLTLPLVSVLVLDPAWGQDSAPGPGDESLLFQEIPSVYGASRFEQKTAEAPSSVTIITAADIEHYGYRTLADILRSTRDFYTTYDRNYAYVGVRGFGRPGDYNSRVLLLIDGHRVNDNIFSTASIGTESIIDVDLIDRVEIIRGPGSSLYGTGAFFGVINVISKRGRDFDGGQVSAEAGSLDTYKGRLSAGKKLTNGGELLVSASGFHSDGQKDLFFPEFDSPVTNNGIAHDLDGDHASNFFGSFSYGDLTLQTGSVTRIKTIPTASFTTVFDAEGTNTTDTRQYVDLHYQHRFDERSNLSARLYYDRYAYDGNYLLAPAPGTPNRDIARGQWWGTDIEYQRMLGTRHRLTVGTEYIDNFQQDQSNFDVTPFQQALDSRVNSHSVSFYGEDEYRALDTLIFNLGLRFDDFYQQGSSTNPRLAAIWLPRPGTALKLLYGTAFRAPNAYESYYGGPNPAINSLNAALQPEKIKTTEAIWEQEITNHWRSSLSAYHYRLENLISLVPDPAHPPQFVYVNSEPVDADGIAMELGYDTPDGKQVRASYAYQRAKVASSGEALSNSPHSLAKLNVATPVWQDRLTAGLEIQYTGPRLTLAGNTAGGFTVANLTLSSRQVWKRFELSASVYNLFDKRYFDPGTANMVQDQIEQDGRLFRLKATYSF